MAGPVSKVEKRARAVLGVDAFQTWIGTSRQVDGRTVTLVSAELMDPPTGGYFSGDDKGQVSRLLEGGNAAILLRLTITQGATTLRNADNPWIIINPPLDGNLNNSRQKMLSLLEEFVRSHT